MKNYFYKILAISLIFCNIKNTQSLSKVFFSPGDNCQDTLIELIGRSNKTIRIALHHFSNMSIFNSILHADRRGVKIYLVTDLDKSLEKDSLIFDLIEAGIVTKVSSATKESNKFIIIDDKVVITSSHSWSKNEIYHDSGNCLVLDHNEIVSAYLERFNVLWFNYFEYIK